MSDGTEVSIIRLPLTSPCPVPVVPITGETIRDGEAISIAERTELCGVDAGWMIGMQRVCDVHLRIFCEVGGIDFDEVIRETFEPHGQEAVRKALERAAVPWRDRDRYSQEETRRWAENAAGRGLG